MKKLADRVLSLFVPEISAGACIADHGCCCNARHTKALTCLGACVKAATCRTLHCFT